MPTPKVTLINHIPNPLETIYILWEASKKDGPVSLSVEEVKATVPQADLEKLFWDVIRQRIPVGESLTFIFMLENVSVSFREQMVRHRIGAKAGDNYGVDTAPDLATSSFWSQSMRIQDMGGFADKRAYRVPESLKGKTLSVELRRPDGSSIDNKAETLFHGAMNAIQDAYNLLVEAGVPMEDARELIPLGAHHRISWTLNLASLLHVFGKRGCWILQLGIWGPVIEGAIKELAEKVHPMFRRIVAPPCVDSNGHFSSCLYREENRRRMPNHADKGGWGNNPPDNHAACPLYLCRDEHGQSYHLSSMENVYRGSGAIKKWVEMRSEALRTGGNEVALSVPRLNQMVERAEDYRDFWHADPYTWDGVQEGKDVKKVHT